MEPRRRRKPIFSIFIHPRARTSSPRIVQYRPHLKSAAAKYAKRFPKIKLFTIDKVFGGWKKAQQTFFADNGVFDQIYLPGK